MVVPGTPQLGKARGLSGLRRGKPKLTLSAAAGAFAPALKSVTIRLPGGLSFAKQAKPLTKGIAVRSGTTKVTFSSPVGVGR